MVAKARFKQFLCSVRELAGSDGLQACTRIEGCLEQRACLSDGEASTCMLCYKRRFPLQNLINGRGEICRRVVVQMRESRVRLKSLRRSASDLRSLEAHKKPGDGITQLLKRGLDPSCYFWPVGRSEPRPNRHTLTRRANLSCGGVRA